MDDDDYGHTVSMGLGPGKKVPVNCVPICKGVDLGILECRGPRSRASESGECVVNIDTCCSGC